MNSKEVFETSSRHSQKMISETSLKQSQYTKKGFWNIFIIQKVVSGCL